MNALEKAEQLKAELDSLRPLDSEAEARIMQKFRLDWNYHSNNLEGNSLTYGETKALILFGITAQGKPLKDHFEITGHNEAINWILEIVKDETVLTEAFIRQLHTLLLKETSYKEAKTPDGKPTRRKIEVGKYKTQPNHVITVTGETFYFATPEETPAKMHDLIEWFRKEKEKADVTPIILAALFHYRFIRIHPFDDGNGRVARILMNFILMQFGYPPVIIKTEDKENYYAVLRLADADELEPFIEYIAENLIRSLEIVIRGAKGESIEEPRDFDKELALLEFELKNAENTIQKVKNKQTMIDLFNDSILPFFHHALEMNRKFSRFYLSTYVTYSFKDYKGYEITFLPHVPIEKDTLPNEIIISEGVESITMTINFREFKHKNSMINYTNKFSFTFDRLTYAILDGEKKELISKLYSQNLNQEEIEKIVKIKAQNHKELIKELITRISESEL
jgi:Fic family protein